MLEALAIRVAMVSSLPSKQRAIVPRVLSMWGSRFQILFVEHEIHIIQPERPISQKRAPSQNEGSPGSTQENRDRIEDGIQLDPKCLHRTCQSVKV